jgi:hypothetical protein
MSGFKTLVLCGFIVSVGYITHINYQKALAAVNNYMQTVYGVNNLDEFDDSTTELHADMQEIGLEYSKLMNQN